MKGISLFLVPKFLVNEDGSLGARNGVVCGSIEHKMGIHGNSTCVMNYDGAKGWLVGEENRGLNAMFVMMNGARLGVAVQGLAQSEVAYQNAAAYAKERLQGRSLTGAKAPEKPADPIIVHPDVRRMLLEIRAFNEAARALMVWVALAEDEALESPDADARQAADDRLGLLTPVIKGVFTDIGFANAVKAQQVLGGHGYIAEWGMEQFVRDARITMIYEGANGIQALDLVGRKLPKDGGRAVDGVLRRGQRLPRRQQGRRRARALSRAGEDRARPIAAGDDVADAERDEEPRQRRRRLDRLHASVRPRSRSAICGRASSRRCWRGRRRGRSNEALDAKLALAKFFNRAYAAGGRRASRAHLERRGNADGAAGGGVLRQTRREDERWTQSQRRRADRRLPMRRRPLSRSTPRRCDANICHCRMCQKAGGAPFMAFAGVPRDEVRRHARRDRDLRQLRDRRARLLRATAARR